MRKYSTITFLLAIVAFVLLTTSVKSYRVYKAESFIKEMLQKMIYVEEEKMIFGNSTVERVLPKDTFLLEKMLPSYQTPSSFYLSATEITNLEWWKFYSDKVREVGKEEAFLLYYPDSSAIVREFPYTYNVPMIRNYFWSTEYDNYPVACISWKQAKEYCIWKSKLFNEAANDIGIDLRLEFRLPNELEWELAAVQQEKWKQDDRIAERYIYPWSGTFYIRDAKYLSNFGRIFDEYGIVVKHHPADGALYYSEIGSYPPSNGGFFDLGGNVAEWVDQIPSFSIEDQIDAYIDSCYVYAKQWESFDLSSHLEKAEYNKKLVGDSKIALVKGGSWADGLAYLQIGSREVRANDVKSSRIGFRIAVSDPGDKYRKYFPKKAWTPK